MVSEKRTLNPQVCQVFHEAVELIGKRWSGAIISVMLQGSGRFCELREGIPGISDRLLTERLKELEEAGIVARLVGDSRPPSVSYMLTEKGKNLAPILDSISEWAHRWNARPL